MLRRSRKRSAAVAGDALADAQFSWSFHEPHHWYGRNMEAYIFDKLRCSKLLLARQRPAVAAVVSLQVFVPVRLIHCQT